MEKQNNNKGVIVLLIVIIVILSVLCVLFATGTISFKSNNINETINKNYDGNFKDNSSYVTYENGESYTFEELKEISNTNIISFKKKYCGVYGTITAKLTKIWDYGSIDGYGFRYVEIWLDGSDNNYNYKAIINYDVYEELIMKMQIGDYLKLTTNKNYKYDVMVCIYKKNNNLGWIEITNPIVELMK